MGLDMYLTARKYFAKRDWKNDIDNPEFDAIVELAPSGLTKFGEYAGINVEFPVAYWRKANAIHGWFVNECAGGRDECQPIPVSHGQLSTLRDLCKSVMLQPAMAWDTLPPTAGFFFGSYDIDEWYMEDMKNTVNMLDHVLSIIPEGDWDWQFTYQASW
jgi:hypothetical protein